MECEILLILKIKFFHFYRNRFAQHAELVVADIIDYSFVNFLIDDIACHLLAESAVKFASRNMTRTETGDRVFLANFFEFFGYFIFVILLLDVNGEHCAHIVFLV